MNLHNDGALGWSPTNAIIMATTATSATSEDEQFLKAYRRIRAVRTRPTTVAANEFFADQDWQSLPKRLERLCHVLQQWVRSITVLYDTLFIRKLMPRFFSWFRTLRMEVPSFRHHSRRMPPNRDDSQ